MFILSHLIRCPDALWRWAEKMQVRTRELTLFSSTFFSAFHRDQPVTIINSFPENSTCLKPKTSLIIYNWTNHSCKSMDLKSSAWRHHALMGRETHSQVPEIAPHPSPAALPLSYTSFSCIFLSQSCHLKRTEVAPCAWHGPMQPADSLGPWPSRDNVGQPSWHCISIPGLHNVLQ